LAEKQHANLQLALPKMYIGSGLKSASPQNFDHGKEIQRPK